MHCTI
jgi:hypothetical protein